MTTPIGMHRDSCALPSDSLNLFKVPDTLSDVEKITYVKKYPISRELNHAAPFEFLIPGSDVDFIDVENITLYVKAKIVNHQNRKLSAEESERVSPTNNFLHSLFKKVEVRIGRETDSQISHSLPTYPYRAYLQELLSRSPEQAENWGSTEGWILDDAGKFDDVGEAEEQTDAEGVKIETWRESHNSGFEERKKMINESQIFEMKGALKVDLCQQSRYLLNQVNLRFSLEKHNPEFYLMFANGEGPFKISFIDIYLNVPYVTLSSSKFVQINKALLTHPAIYPIQRVEVSDCIINPHFKTVRFDNLFSSTQELPSRLVLTIVSNDRISGACDLNPFLFYHHNVEALTLKIDGVTVGGTPYQMEFDQDCALEPFFDLWTRLGYKDGCSSLDLNYHQFLNGCTLYVFDLTPGETAGSGCLHVGKKANVNLEIVFQTPSPASLNLLVYAEYQSFLEINHNRDVYLSWFDG